MRTKELAHYNEQVCKLNECELINVWNACESIASGELDIYSMKQYGYTLDPSEIIGNKEFNANHKYFARNIKGELVSFNHPYLFLDFDVEQLCNDIANNCTNVIKAYSGVNLIQYNESSN